ncbi:hypothetical protein AKJ08_3514 [Vulgatibacter incomptus]|uniref:Uncharacterized protein n=1 Tax=Vulgatibacter incomptus TaxID=1391653 RepID=A0A0K1PHY4_9BACT|nr:hypothetical protein AKJ08_3514 [Vulgatibacter incomptus]
MDGPHGRALVGVRVADTGDLPSVRGEVHWIQGVPLLWTD